MDTHRGASRGGPVTVDRPSPTPSPPSQTSHLPAAQIPAGTQPGTTLVMAKKGVPRLGNAGLRGDHLVQVNVSIPGPGKLSAKEKALIEELSALRKQSAAGAGGKGWL